MINYIEIDGKKFPITAYRAKHWIYNNTKSFFLAFYNDDTYFQLFNLPLELWNSETMLVDVSNSVVYICSFLHDNTGEEFDFRIVTLVIQKKKEIILGTGYLEIDPFEEDTKRSFKFQICIDVLSDNWKQLSS